MKSEFSARYVRLYGVCDEPWFNDALVDAAAGAGVGLYGLVWFGFDGGDEWKGRMDRLVTTIKTNPKVGLLVMGIRLGRELITIFGRRRRT
jgi:hypothetical protein